MATEIFWVLSGIGAQERTDTSDSLPGIGPLCPLLSPESPQRPSLPITGNWKQELPKFISSDQLPVEFGGTMTDPDGNPKCLT